jgi:tetratricopeptide (TPR) repeat protein
MRVPLRAIRQSSAGPVRGAWVPGAEAASALKLCADLGLDPTGRVFGARGGLLVTWEGPVLATIAGAVALRRLGGRLYLPADGELDPALLDDEVAGLTRGRGLIFLPGGEALAFEPDRPIPVAQLIGNARARRDGWRAFPAPPSPIQLREILDGRPVPEEPLDAIDGGEIAAPSEAPAPGRAGLGAKIRGGLAMGAGRAMMGLGKLLGLGKLARAGAERVRRGLEMSPQLAEQVMGLQAAALQELLRRFQSGDVEEAMRQAPRMGGEPGRGARASSATRLGSSRLLYSLRELLGDGGGGGGSLWATPDDLRRELMREYRKAANDAARRGDFRRAATILGKLCGDYAAAAQMLERGGLHRDAAQVYLRKLNDRAAAARSFRNAGDFDQALALYREAKDHASAGDLLRFIGEDEAAGAEYDIAAISIWDRTQSELAVGEFEIDRAGRKARAIEWFELGWHEGEPCRGPDCLIRLARIRAEEGNADAIARLSAEAEPFFEENADDQQVSAALNELARLVQVPAFGAIRAEVRDRSLRGLASRLRRRSLRDSHPVTSVQEVLGSGAWSGAAVTDAEYAYRAALPKAPKRPAASGRAEVHTFALVDGPIRCACASDSGDYVIIGTPGGAIWGYERGGAKAVLIGTEPGWSVESVNCNPGATEIAALFSRDEVGIVRTYRYAPQRGFQAHGRMAVGAVRGCRKAVSNIIGAADDASRMFGIGGREGFQFGGDRDVPGSVVDHINRLGAVSARLVERPGGRVFFLAAAPDGLVSFELEMGGDGLDDLFAAGSGDAAEPEASGTLETAFLALARFGSEIRLDSIVWADSHGNHCEFAGITGSGAVAWGYVPDRGGSGRMMPQSFEPAGADAGFPPPEAVALIRPGCLAAVAEGRVDWYRAGAKGIKHEARTEGKIREPLAAFAAGDGRRIQIVGRDGRLTLVEIPERLR